MYIRLVNFKLKPGNKSEVMKIADEFVPAIKSQKGCADCRFIMDEETSEYGFVVLWKTKQDADAASDIIGPRLIPKINKISVEPVKIHLYQAYEPVMVPGS
jgi:quinol monooxygenase YgiN